MPAVKSKILENGMQVILVPHKVGSVTACLRGLAGSNFEKPKEIGAAHILEHVLTYRSQNFSKGNSLRNIVFAPGGRITGTTSRDDVAFLCKVLKNDFEKALLYLSEIFFCPLVTKEDLDKAKNIISHEIFHNVDNPKKHIARISYKILYPNQRFAIFNTGDIRHLKPINTATLKGFAQRYYHPKNFVLSVCGDLPEVNFFDAVEALFNKDGFYKLPFTKENIKHNPNRKFSYQIENRINISQLHLKIDYHGFKTSEKEKYTAFLLSRLFLAKLRSNIRELYPVAKLSPYILDAASFSSNTYGLFGMYTSIKPQDLKKFLFIYHFTRKQILDGKYTNEELKFLKHKINADFQFTFEKTSLRADFYSELFLYDQLNNSHHEELSKYLNIEEVELDNVAKKIFLQRPKITIIDKLLTNQEFEKIWNEVIIKV